MPPESVLDYMDIKEGDTIIDIGAGTGYFAIPAMNYTGDKGKVIAVSPVSQSKQE